MEQENNNINENANDATRQAPDDKETRKEWLRRRRIERRNRRNARIARGRFFKNLFIWILGVLFLPIVLVAATFVVPIGTFTGNNGEVVSRELEKKSVFEIVKFVAGNTSEIGFSDFPVIAKSFDDLQNTSIGDGKTVSDIISIDTEKLNTIRFNDANLFDEITSCVEIVATIESFGGAEMLGDFGHLSVFSEEEAVGTVAEVLSRGENAETRKQYYYKTGEGKYVRAFDDSGNLVSGLNGGETLYYPPLVKIKLSELKDIFGELFGRIKVVSLLDVFDARNETFVDIIGEDTTISELKDFDINSINLNVILEEKSEGEEGYADNKKLWDILKAATSAGENLTIGDLIEEFDLDNVPLNTVLDGIDVSDNNVLSALKEKDVKIGRIGEALNELTLYDVYGNKAFTTTPIAGARRFNKTTYNGRVCFDYSPTGEYYLDNSTGIWLILCFDTATYNDDDTVAERFSDTNGNPIRYIADELTIGDMQDGRSFSRKFRNATLKQLIDTHLLDGDALGGGSLSQKTQAMSLQDILQILASPQVQAYINSH